MKKLISGIIDFRKTMLPARRHQFAELAKGQSPDSLFITCSDSRVAPNWFASTDPGDLFVVRNVGNLIPPCGDWGMTEWDKSEFAAVEFAILALNVRDIIVCGHSECGAMNAVCNHSFIEGAPHLRSWLSHAEVSLKILETEKSLNSKMSRVNQLSQINVLQQIEHLKTYPLIQKRLADGTLNIHGWWFEIAEAAVHAFDEKSRSFKLIE